MISFAIAVVVVSSATLSPAATANASAEELAQEVGVRLLGEAVVPHKMSFEDTTVGGLSGIDRDPCTGDYVLISDDRSYLEPARFYTADIDFDESGIHGVELTGTHPFRQPDGATYPSPALNDGKAVDPEELRVDPLSCQYWWAQEGNRPNTVGASDPVIQPSIQFATRTGAYDGQLELPANYEISMDERGPRRNQSLEAITFDTGGMTFTSAVEGPLIQDGPVPTTEHGALTRVTMQTRAGTVLGQYAYPLEPIFAEVDPDSPWVPDTGVPAILAHPDDPTRFLMLERTYVDGSGYKIRLFDATIRGATDVQDIDSLVATEVEPMEKTLIADLHDLDLSAVDNTEGMTWGPTLPTGERTLVLVSDDNFYELGVSQIIALAVD